MPVLPLESIPSPGFQGLACITDGHPVILLGQRYDELGRVAFLIAHEAAHIAYGDCSANVPVVDGDEDDLLPKTEMEIRADAYANLTLTGADVAFQIDNSTITDHKRLAEYGLRIEQELGADASQVIFSVAAIHGNYSVATRAVKALSREIGGRLILRSTFDKYVDVENASDTDRSLLRCVYGDQ